MEDQFSRAMSLVAQERDYHGQQWSGGHRFREKPMLWLAVLMEEVGECATDILEEADQNHLLGEAVQVAAVAIALIEEILESQAPLR